jgi:hypothetical protein
MPESFIKQLQGIDLEFHRFYNHLGKLTYLASYKTGMKDEVLILLLEDNDGDWKFMYKQYVPSKILPLENEIDSIVKANEKN